MSAPLVTASTTILCEHGGMAMEIDPGSSVTSGGVPVATIGDVHHVSGCPAALPCATVRWAVGSSRVTAYGVPVMIETGVGVVLCGDGAVRGEPVIIASQQRVVAAS